MCAFPFFFFLLLVSLQCTQSTLLVFHSSHIHSGDLLDSSLLCVIQLAKGQQDERRILLASSGSGWDTEHWNSSRGPFSNILCRSRGSCYKCGGVSPGRPYTHRRTRHGAPGPRRSGTSAGLCHRFGISAAAPAKREDASNILAKVCRNRSVKNVLSCISWSFMAHSNKKMDCQIFMFPDVLCGVLSHAEDAILKQRYFYAILRFI